MTEMLLGVEVSDSTIYRLTDSIGNGIGEIIDLPETRAEINLTVDENLYVQVDGSMLLTREEGWKEVKLGRVFKSSSIFPESTERQWIKGSEYVAHMGGHTDFENLMSQLIDEPYRLNESQIVFVGDGARWQLANNKSKMNYPQYLKEKLLIGSGAIESAHRTVLQKRMKQSGQRWSNKGLHNMIKLRTASMSGYWNEIQALVRKAA